MYRTFNVQTRKKRKDQAPKGEKKKTDQQINKEINRTVI